MDISNFGRWLKNKMDEKGWSQSETGRRSGISQAQIGRLLMGTRQPGIKACKSLANALDCSVYDVYRAAGLFNLADEQYEPTRFRDWLLAQIGEKRLFTYLYQTGICLYLIQLSNALRRAAVCRFPSIAYSRSL